MELATGEFPFHNWRDIFQQISEIVHKDPPCLDSDKFSDDLVNFVKAWYVQKMAKKTCEQFFFHKLKISFSLLKKIDIQGGN